MKIFKTIILVFLTANLFAQEAKHLSNITQLTFGGDNAEAYFNNKGDKISFQSNYKKWGNNCDQIHIMNLNDKVDSTKIPTRISNGEGRTTCSYYMPDNKHILFASTFKSGKDCPPSPPFNPKKYLWAIYNTFDIYVADENGKITQQLTNDTFYSAEATISPKGDKIVYTSTAGGDLDLWIMDIDGKNKHQITHELGYDGGAFFSPDGKQLVFRASRPKGDSAIANYKSLLQQNLVAPTEMEIFVCNVDGSNLHQVTHLGKANWAPYFTHDGKKIIFSSNHAGKKGYDFHLWMINVDGTGLEQITTESYFNAFPMFSPDGKKLIFSSNRNNHGTHDTNLFIADWKE